jgi:hypothetical protein
MGVLLGELQWGEKHSMIVLLEEIESIEFNGLGAHVVLFGCMNQSPWVIIYKRNISIAKLCVDGVCFTKFSFGFGFWICRRYVRCVYGVFDRGMETNEFGMYICSPAC